MAKAIALLSGGLDSILAARLMIEQSIELEAVNFLTVFCNCTSRGKTCLASKTAADELGIKLKVFEISQEYLEILKNPKHGYGKNMNPCLDCRIFIFRKAKEYMAACGAAFIVTGEVLGERPMSQRKAAMDIIEKESGLKGLILRPLSARLFKPTIAEEERLVDRGRLLSIQGRCRKPQIQLAKDFDIKNYPCPSGGCLLTYKGFADRVRDLMRYKPEFCLDDIKLLKHGRHFRLTPKAKLVVGRDETDNKRLMGLAKDEDVCFYPVGAKGPVGIGRGPFSNGDIETASSIIARYSDGDTSEELKIEYKIMPKGKAALVLSPRLDDEQLSALRI